MTARISLILGKTRGHRPRLQLRDSSFFRNLQIDRMDQMESASSCPFCVLAGGVDSFHVESKQSDIYATSTIFPKLSTMP
jgi:hypothetical protein